MTQLENNSSLYSELFYPDELNQLTYNEYLKYGVQINSFLFSFNQNSRIYRVDFASETGAKSEELVKIRDLIIHNLIKWTLYGNSLPFPILLAHEKCTLKKVVSDVLFQEYLSKSLRDKEENIIAFKKLGAD